jgi:oligosaccharide 4-alpha-D-glucosyltransferase
MKKNSLCISICKAVLRRSVLLLLLIFFSLGITAQVITLSPEKPAFNQEVTLTYFADRGNAQLENYEGDIFVHTGLITNESKNLGEWKKVVADWGDNEKSPRMTKTGDNSYELTFKIADLYGIPVTGGNVVALAFVFRNEDGSKVGKEKGGEDIFYFYKKPKLSTQPKVWEVSKTVTPEWSSYASLYEVNIRQYTEEGTINAFSQHLDRLRDLGVDILWIMPIQPIGVKKRKGPLGSYYSIKDYTAVNPEFGTLDDFKNMVQKAHGMGFKVILDWVANHSAWDHIWMENHQDWYTKDAEGNPISPYDWTDVADLNYEQYYMRKSMTEAMKFWVEEADIDGFRCDVAGEVPLDFWVDTRKELNELKETWLLAEDGSQLWLLNQAFNANYDWHFHHLMNQIAKGKAKATEILPHFEFARKNMPEGSYSMQFITNHDENSWAGTVYERMGDAHKTFAVLSFTVPGIPLIYSGQEAGLNKRLKFFDRDPIDWSDLSLMPFYKRLNDLKAQNPALWNGQAGAWPREMVNDKKEDVLSFIRAKGQNKVLSILNLSDKTQDITLLAGTDEGIYKDFFTGDTLTIFKRTKLHLDSWGYRVLIYQRALDKKDRQFQKLEKEGYQERKGLSILTSDGDIVFSFQSPHAVEVEFLPVGKCNPPSYALTPISQKVETELKEYADSIVYGSSALDVIIHKDPFQIQYRYLERKLTSEEKGFFETDSTSGFRFYLTENEKITGGGERVLGMNRRGHRLTLYNQPSYGYEEFAELMYYSMPVFLSSNKYMLVFDNGAKGYADLGKSEKDILELGAVGGRMSYSLVAAQSWQELATHFTEITGRQPMLPRWALGNISSRMGYHSQREAEHIVEKYLDEDIPLDAIVFDLYWFGPDLKGHMGNLDWYRDSFPEPLQMMQDFKRKGVKTILITEPFILRGSKTYAEVIDKDLVGKTANGEPYHYDFYFGNTTLLDLFKEETRDWFWSIYKKHTESGVDGWWGDLGEPEMHPYDLVHVNGKAIDVHNLYGHEWARTIYEGYARDFPEKRPVILMRSGFVGSQRYGMVPWTGDVNRTWGGLKPQVELSLSMGLQGIGLMHSDLGGFAGDYKDAELYTRWLQYGVFQPIYRTHAQESTPPEPIFWDKKTKDIAREFIKLRYRLLPYNYTLLFKNTRYGTPLMRPLFYMEDNMELFDKKDQYLWGDAFLVAPVLEKGLKRQKIYFPKDHFWFDFWNDELFKGGKSKDYALSLETIPVFVKAGSFIPMVEAKQSTRDYDASQIDLHYYHHSSVARSEGMLYDDDGKTKNAYEKGEYELLTFTSSYREKTLSIKIQGSINDQKKINLMIHGLKKFKGKLMVDGQEREYEIQKGMITFTVDFRGKDLLMLLK